jgi:hypothetical protein
VLVLSADGTITDYTLYSLGFYNIDDMNKITEDALKGNKVTPARGTPSSRSMTRWA